MPVILGRQRVQPFVRTKSISANYTVTLADAGWLIVVDTSGGNITVSLPAVATAGDGFVVTVKRISSGANTLTIDPSGAETVEGAATLSMPTQYTSLVLVSRSTGWFIGSAPIPLGRTITAGSGLTGGGALSGDVTLSGTAASTSTAGVQQNANQAAMEALTASRTVTPDVQQYHPGHPKAWVNFNGTGTPAIRADYNVTSITDNGTGQQTVNLDITMGATTFSVVTSAATNEGVPASELDVRAMTNVPVRAVGSFRMTAITVSASAINFDDSECMYAAVLGDAA